MRFAECSSWSRQGGEDAVGGVGGGRGGYEESGGGGGFKVYPPPRDVKRSGDR